MNFALFLTFMHTKNQFIQILHGYLSSTEDDARQIETLKEKYPYSQVLHALFARLSKDHGLPTQQKDLQQAAVHAADRTVLKDIMTRSYPWPVSHEAEGQTNPATPESISAAHAPVHEEEETVAEDVMFELNRLTELRHNFESMFEAGNSPSVSVAEREENTPASSAAPAASEDPEDVPPAKKPKGRVGRKPGRAKAQRIIELARALEKRAEESPTDDEPSAKKQRQKKNDSGPEDGILNDIEQSKKKLSPETGKQQEQLEIIDQCISADPRITNLRE